MIILILTKELPCKNLKNGLVKARKLDDAITVVLKENGFSNFNMDHFGLIDDEDLLSVRLSIFIDSIENDILSKMSFLFSFTQIFKFEVINFNAKV